MMDMTRKKIEQAQPMTPIIGRMVNNKNRLRLAAAIPEMIPEMMPMPTPTMTSQRKRLIPCLA